MKAELHDERPIYLPGGLPQSGHASLCHKHDGECERKLVNTKVESESEEGH